MLAAKGSSSLRSTTASLPRNADVLELPRVGLIEVFGEQPLALVQRRPVCIAADDRAEIRRADFQVAPEVDLIGLDDAAVRVLPQTTPESTAIVTCRLVALLYGASLRASSMESCEPYQYAFFLCPASSTPSSSMPLAMSSIRIRCRSCCT